MLLEFIKLNIYKVLENVVGSVWLLFHVEMDLARTSCVKMAFHLGIDGSSGGRLETTWGLKSILK